MDVSYINEHLLLNRRTHDNVKHLVMNFYRKLNQVSLDSLKSLTDSDNIIDIMQQYEEIFGIHHPMVMIFHRLFEAFHGFEDVVKELAVDHLECRVGWGDMVERVNFIFFILFFLFFLFFLYF